MQNEAQYNLGRKAAKISALSFNNLDKYEYLTGEDLGLKPSNIEQAKCEYSPLGKSFNQGLDKDDQKEGLFKRLKNTENAQKSKINSKIRKIMKVMKIIKMMKTMKMVKIMKRRIKKDNKTTIQTQNH